MATTASRRLRLTGRSSIPSGGCAVRRQTSAAASRAPTVARRKHHRDRDDGPQRHAPIRSVPLAQVSSSTPQPASRCTAQATAPPSTAYQKSSPPVRRARGPGRAHHSLGDGEQDRGHTAST